MLWTGIGCSLQTAVLHYLWNVTEHEARDTTDTLWAYGLVQFSDIIIPPHNSTQRCLEVHAVISQYVVECMDSKEAIALSTCHDGLDTSKLVSKELLNQFKKSSPMDESGVWVCGSDYLKCESYEIENFKLPYYLKHIQQMILTKLY